MDRVIDDKPQHVLVDRPDPRPPSVPEVDDSERGEGPECFAHDGSRNAELGRKPGFGRDRIAGAQALGADVLVDRAHSAVDQPSFSLRPRLHEGQAHSPLFSMTAFLIL